MKRTTLLSSLLPAVLGILAASTCAQVHSSQLAKTALPFLTISPTGPLTMDAGSTRQFVANGDGSRDAGVSLAIMGIRCQETDCGTISTDGLYRAPSTVANSLEVTVLARSTVPPFMSTSEQIVVVPRSAKGRRALCTSTQPGYCRVEWQIHQMFAPYVW